MLSLRIPILTALSALALLAAGCSSTKLAEKPAPVTDNSGATPPAAPSRGVTQVEAPPQAMGDPLSDPKGILSKRSVYFDYDSTLVKPDFQAVIEAHGRYLATYKARHVVVEGNCDERGGREYNLALGQRRADAVKQRLALLGAGDSQIDTISNGKEKPRADGHDEAAWAENRRADIVYR